MPVLKKLTIKKKRMFIMVFKVEVKLRILSDATLQTNNAQRNLTFVDFTLLYRMSFF